MKHKPNSNLLFLFWVFLVRLFEQNKTHPTRSLQQALGRKGAPTALRDLRWAPAHPKGNFVLSFLPQGVLAFPSSKFRMGKVGIQNGFPNLLVLLKRNIWRRRGRNALVHATEKYREKVILASGKAGPSVSNNFFRTWFFSTFVYAFLGDGIILTQQNRCWKPWTHRLTA